MSTNKRFDKLTMQQEKFCQEIAKGETQTDAYLIAYPKSKKWLRQSVWVEASKLMDKEKIQKRIEELKEDTLNDVKWTRKKILSNLNYILSESKQSIERKKQIYQEMIDDKYKELMQWVNLLNVENINTKGVNKNINRIKKEINDLELQKNINPSDTKGILNTIKIINRMQGYDLTKQEQEDNNENEKVEELRRELTIDELRQLAYKKEISK